MIYRKGERVAINLDIENFKKGDEIKMGIVISCKENIRNNPGTLFHPVLTEVRGDDGETYYSLQLGQGLGTPVTLMNIDQCNSMMYIVRAEVESELTLLETYENLYTINITRRIEEGIAYTKLAKHYDDFIVSNISILRMRSNAIKYLMPALQKAFTLPQIVDKSIKDDEDDDGDSP